MCTIYTTGYEGESITQFIQKLHDNEINCVVDVREIPISRKKGFSKNAIALALKENGIGYVHMKALGSPKGIRDELHATHDYSVFFQKYRCYVVNQLDQIVEVLHIAKRARTCLLCFEKDCKTCHRSVIADIMVNEMPGVDGAVNI